MLPFTPARRLRLGAGLLLSVGLSLAPSLALAHPDHHQPTQQGQNPAAQQPGGHEHDHQH